MSNLSANFDSGNLSIFTANLVKETLFNDNSFLTKFTDVTSYLNGRYVNFPFYTNSTVVTKNSSTFDVNAVTQTEQTTVQMITDVYRANPTLITAFEGDMLNFDKASIEVGQQVAGVENKIADEVLKALVLDTDASRVIATSGSNGVANRPDNVTAAKKIQYADFLKLKKSMDKDNVKGERYLIVDAETFSEILGDASLSKYLETGYASVVEGKYPKIAGINIIERGETVALTSAGAVKIYGTDTMASTDMRISLAFVGDAVGYAYGNPNIYSAVSPAQFGVVQSVETYLAVKNLRADKKGVYYIKQG